MIVKYLGRATENNSVPFSVSESTLTVGNEYSNVKLDLEALQQDSSIDVPILEDYMGNLKVSEGNATAMIVKIPPSKYTFVETGEVNDKGEKVVSKKKIPVDVENVELIVWKLLYALKNKED
jgi:hypothetical protein